MGKFCPLAAVGERNNTSAHVLAFDFSEGLVFVKIESEEIMN